MLVALGDKPARRVRTANTSSDTEVTRVGRNTDGAAQGTKSQLNPGVSHRRTAVGVHEAVQSETAADDAGLAAELIASRVTTQPIETVVAVLAARRRSHTINAAAKALEINYRTAQRIVDAAENGRRVGLSAAS